MCEQKRKGIMGQDQSSIVENKVMSNMMVKSVTTNTTECFSDVSGNQNISISTGAGYPSLRDADGPCEFCLDIVNDIYEARLQLEIDANVGSSGKYTSVLLGESSTTLVNDPVITAMTTGFLPESSSSSNDDVTSLSKLSPCSAMCNSVIVTSVSQRQVFEASADCSVTTVANNDIEQSIQGQIESNLKNQEDVLGALTGLMGGDENTVTSTITSSITQNIDTDFVNELITRARNVQSITVTNSNSMYLSDVSQGFELEQIGSLEATNTITNQLKQSAAFSVTQGLTTQNDTIGDLLKLYTDVFDTIFDIVDNFVSTALVLATIAICTYVLVWAIVYTISPVGRGFIHSNLGIEDDTQRTNSQKSTYGIRFPMTNEMRP
jgi:hypothetical protein